MQKLVEGKKSVEESFFASFIATNKIGRRCRSTADRSKLGIINCNLYEAVMKNTNVYNNKNDLPSPRKPQKRACLERFGKENIL